MTNNQHHTFQVLKTAGTYADTLEAYGLAYLLRDIFEAQNKGTRLSIEDKGIYYEIRSNEAVDMGVIGSLPYFQVIEFIKKKEKDTLPTGIGNSFYDYPLQRDLRRQKRKEIEKIVNKPNYQENRKRIEEKYTSEQVAQPLRIGHDVFAQLISNPYAAFLKLYNNFDNNQAYFGVLLTEILNHYLPPDQKRTTSFEALVKDKKIVIEDKATMLQLLNPNQGKGLNKAKATGISTTNLKGSWVQETLKISAASRFTMLCQSVKVGSTYDLKIFVPAFKYMKLNDMHKILERFKRLVKSNTPIKLDILNTLQIIKLFLKQSDKKVRRGKVSEHLLGLHTVYQKDLGQNKAVTNIGFLETPNFIDLEDKDDWLSIIEHQQSLINGITEQGDSMVGLLAYRQFLSGLNIKEYLKFHYWYASYLMSELSNKKQSFLSPNRTNILDKIFNHLNNSTMKFKEIISNEGFRAVAAAIRKSTVILQYTSKDSRGFEVQYGLAQKLQSKSKSKDDLIAFVSEFVAKYNAVTAMKAEKNKGEHSFRKPVRNHELDLFFELADEVSPKVLGAMLAAYGFALDEKKSEETQS